MERLPKLVDPALLDAEEDDRVGPVRVAASAPGESTGHGGEATWTLRGFGSSLPGSEAFAPPDRKDGREGA